MRAAIYKETVATIDAFNANESKTSSVAINAFADNTEGEWARMRGFIPSDSNAERVSLIKGEPARTVNWVNKGMVEPPKDQ